MFWFSHSTLYTLALRWGLFSFIFLVNFGNCKDSQSESSSSPSAIKSSLFDHQHTHSKWDSWSLPSSQEKSSLLPWDQQVQMPNIVPLTLQEQAQRVKKSSKGKTKKLRDDHHHQNQASQVRGTESKSSEPKKGKSDDNSGNSTASSPEDLSAIRDNAFSFGKLVLHFLAKQVLASPEDLAKGSEGRSFPSSTFQAEARQEGGGEGEGNRNRVIDWVARLIGVQGKTLGEFLREYQVHVLYDLVFTFFKWIFFLYAGLLIP